MTAVRDVFEENQSQNHVFVFRRVQVAAQNAGSIPDLFFKSDVRGIFLCHMGPPDT